MKFTPRGTPKQRQRAWAIANKRGNSPDQQAAKQKAAFHRFAKLGQK